MADDGKKKKAPLTKREKEAYRNNWTKENLDRINLTVEKGRREQLKAYAEEHGESLNSFINRAIDTLIASENASSEKEDHNSLSKTH